MSGTVVTKRATSAQGPSTDFVDGPLLRRRWWLHEYLWSVLLGVAVLALVEYAVRSDWVSDIIVPRPSDVWMNLRNGFATGLYWAPLFSTLQATVIGFLISAVLALTVAAVLVTSRRLERIMMPYIVAFQTTPKLALAPIILLALGFGMKSKITIIVIVCFFPMLVNSLQGLRLRNREQAELMSSLGASKFQVFRYIRIPNSAPYVFAGLQIGLIFALLGAIVAEFVGAPDGLGVLMLQQKAQFNIAGLWAVLFILMVIGLVLRQITLLLERHFARWAEDVTPN